MKKGISKILFIVVALVSISGLWSISQAQTATDVLRYSRQYPGYDPVTMVMPGVAYAAGFGAYQENPAVMALFDESFISGGLSDRYVNEKAFYLGNESTFDVNTLGISHAGFVYKFPTTRGSLVVGGGYSQTAGYNRAIAVSGRNTSSTITDYYNSRFAPDALFFTAFDVFAIDYSTTDKVYSETLSIFRLIRNNYQGIYQTIELTEKGVMGEYSAFIATELFKNFVVGASIGAITGNYNYDLKFLESDRLNNYERGFTDESGNIIGIDHILSESSINANFTGFSARLGIVYQITPHINFGASYQFKNTLFIEEEFNTVITNTLDDGFTYQDDAPGKISYKIVRPARLNLGLAITDYSGFTVSAAIERVAYTEARIEFDNIEYTDAENAINNTVQSSLEDVLNLRFGLSYEVTERFTPRIGYGYYPSPVEDKNTDRQFYSGGFSAQVSPNTTLNVGVQYSTWEDEAVLYRSNFGTAAVEENVHRWNIMAGLTYYF